MRKYLSQRAWSVLLSAAKLFPLLAPLGGARINARLGLAQGRGRELAGRRQ
jgi:hypothetical protein